MSYSFDSNNDRLRGTFTSSYALPVTVACFFKVTDHPITNDVMVQLGNEQTTANDSLILRAAGAADNRWELICTDSAGASSIINVVLNVDNSWCGIVGVNASNTSREMWLQAIANTDSGVNNRVIGSALKYIGVGENLADGHDFAGLIAEVAMWDVALDSDQAAAYLGGQAASSIGSPIGYWPLSAANATQVNEGSDADGDLTVTGATFDADHPTITIPSSDVPNLFVVRSAMRWT